MTKHSVSICALALVALFTGVAFGQSSFPLQAVGINVGFCQTCPTQTQGGVWYARRITDNAHPTYSYTAININQATVNSLKPLNIQVVTTMETGAAQHVSKFGRFDVYGLFTGGLAVDSTNTGLSLGGGGMATTGVGKSKEWTVGLYGGPSKTAITPGTGWKVGLTLGYAPSR